MLDAIGQTIGIGDIVAASGNASFYGYNAISVVTRFGNADNVQINGSSFVDRKSIIVITEQYDYTFGPAKSNEVVQEYKDNFDYTLPEVKVSKRYVVLRLSTYETKEVKSKVKYYVVATTANKQQMYKDIKVVVDKFNSEFKCEYSQSKSLEIRTKYFAPYDTAPVFSYGTVDQSLKFIKEHNLKAFIDSEITSPEALEKLASYEVR